MDSELQSYVVFAVLVAQEHQKFRSVLHMCITGFDATADSA